METRDRGSRGEIERKVGMLCAPILQLVMSGEGLPQHPEATAEQMLVSGAFALGLVGEMPDGTVQWHQGVLEAVMGLSSEAGEFIAAEAAGDSGGNDGTL